MARYNRRVKRNPRFVYAGTYEADYPRNLLTLQALRDCGVVVELAHIDTWRGRRAKSGLAGFGMLRFGLALSWAYLRLLPALALRLMRCDALVLGYIGQIDALILAPLARLMGKRVLFDPLVTLTDTLVEDRQRFKPGSLAARIIAVIDRRALRNADVVLVDTASNREHWIHEHGLVPEQTFVVPVGADDEQFFPSDRDRAAANEPLDILFVGKFIPLHGIDTIIRAAALIEQRHLPVTFELVGRGQTWESKRALALELGVGNLTWTDWIEPEHLGARLRAADIALGVFSAGPKAGRVVPNKVFQSFACGVATITQHTPAYADATPALFVPPDDPEALAAAIAQLMDQASRARIGSAGRAWYVENANRARRAAAVQAAIDRLLA